MAPRLWLCAVSVCDGRRITPGGTRISLGWECHQPALQQDDGRSC